MAICVFDAARLARLCCSFQPHGAMRQSYFVISDFVVSRHVRISVRIHPYRYQLSPHLCAAYLPARAIFCLRCAPLLP